MSFFSSLNPVKIVHDAAKGISSVAKDPLKAVRSTAGSVKDVVSNPLHAAKKGVGTFNKIIGTTNPNLKAPANAKEIRKDAVTAAALAGAVYVGPAIGKVIFGAPAVAGSVAPPVATEGATVGITQAAGDVAGTAGAVKTIDNLGKVTNLATNAMQAGTAWQQFKGGGGVGVTPAQDAAAASSGSVWPWALVALPILYLVLR